MCDFVEGEMVFSFPGDPALVDLMSLWFQDHGGDAHMDVLDRLDERCAALELPGGARVTSPQQFWRIRVPYGQEVYKSNYLRQEYDVVVLRMLGAGLIQPDRLGDLLLQAAVSPNHLLTLAGPHGGGPVQLTATHRAYKEMVGADEPSPRSAGPATGPVVALVDSGVTEDVADRVVRRVDLVSPDQFGQPHHDDDADVTDQVLHGTAVASIVADVAPHARLMIYRVADAAGRASEFDVLAALLSMGDADVVNLSLAFGFARGDCHMCGRAANSSRSFVFEQALAFLTARPDPPIVVAASGNAAKKDALAYPARFGSVVAVGAVNSQRRVSRFSNRGTKDHLDARHDRVWFLPGGDDRPAAEEAPAVAGDDKRPMWGTSFACAYASGLIARALESRSKADVRELLATATGAFVVDEEPAAAAHGILTLATLAS